MTVFAAIGLAAALAAPAPSAAPPVLELPLAPDLPSELRHRAVLARTGPPTNPPKRLTRMCCRSTPE